MRRNGEVPDHGTVGLGHEHVRACALAGSRPGVLPEPCVERVVAAGERVKVMLCAQRLYPVTQAVVIRALRAALPTARFNPAASSG